LKKNKKSKKKINKQKVFCFISFIFILICCLWYGGRAIYFYLNSRKTVENKDKLLAQTIIDKNYNTDNFKKINSDYYFYKDAKNNYLTYSNLTWRIVKISKDNEITLISDNPLTILSYGKNKTLKNSYITKWLNESNDTNTGILEKNLSNKTNYLMKTKTCSDNIKNIKNITCKKTNNNNYLSLLSVADYINTGAKNSFINNGYYTYLANNKGKKVWYINDEGTIDTSDGTDIYGVKVTITIKPTVSLISGKGTEKSPYIIEEKNNYFASYVNLDDDIWRVYDEDEKYIKLSLNDYLKINDEKLEYIYSNDDYFHNDTIYGSLAYYLNHLYLNSLTYNNLIINNEYSNNYYGEDNNYNWITTIKKTVDTKVATLSIGNPILNSNLDNYFTSTGTGKNDLSVYIIKKDATTETVDVDEEYYVIPCITILKENLKTGSGTINDPYRTE
jgi:hypothetical protein